MSAALCPRCGFDPAEDEVIEHGAIRFDPRGDVVWQGRLLELTACKRTILGMLLKDFGRTVATAALLDRLGTADRHLLAVHISGLRSALTSRGEPDPIIKDVGRGYRWAA